MFAKIKKCEGRLLKGDFGKIKKGDFIFFENNEFGFLRKCYVNVESVNIYNSFTDYLLNESLIYCLPGIETLEQGLNIYYNYYKKKDEKKI